MANEMIKYNDYYVAYMDLLGFKELIRNEKCEYIYSLFDLIKKGHIVDMTLNDEHFDVMDKVKYKIMSDSIVLYIHSDIDDALFALILSCQKLQMELLLMDNPILLRGGIARGSLFVSEDIIYGEGLTNAYLIESSVAIYPRIVFYKDLLKSNIPHCKEIDNEVIKFYCLEDDDELCMVNFLFIFPWLHSIDSVQYIENILKLCQKYIDSSYNFSVRNKYLWLKKKTTTFLLGYKETLKHFSEWEEYFNNKDGNHV